MKPCPTSQRVFGIRRYVAALLAIAGSAIAVANPASSAAYSPAPAVRIAIIESADCPNGCDTELLGEPMPASTTYDHGGEAIHVTTFEFGEVDPVSATYGGRRVSVPFSRPACSDGFVERVCAAGESPNSWVRHFTISGDSGQFTFTVAERKDPSNTRSTTIYIR